VRIGKGKPTATAIDKGAAKWTIPGKTLRMKLT